MKISNMIHAVDLHACGEPGRVIVGGVLDVPGESMFEKIASGISCIPYFGMTAIPLLKFENTYLKNFDDVSNLSSKKIPEKNG